METKATKTTALVLMAALTLVLTSGEAEASDPRQPISSLPYTIVTPGSYYLPGDLTSQENGIIVAVDNVTIDMMGHSVFGPKRGELDPNGSNPCKGILLSGRTNVEIKDGSVVGFYDGISSWSCERLERGLRLINLRIVSTTGDGVQLFGEGHLIKDCTIIDAGHDGLYTTGASTITGTTVAGASAVGIGAGAEGGCMVTGNIVRDCGGPGITAGRGSTVMANAVSNCAGGISARGATVTDNATCRNGHYGLNVSGGSAVLPNTVCENNAGATVAAGIMAEDACFIQDNSIGSNGFSNILIHGAGNVIQNNHISNSPGYGICFFEKGNFYAGNRLTGNATAAFARFCPATLSYQTHKKRPHYQENRCLP